MLGKCYNRSWLDLDLLRHLESTTVGPTKKKKLQLSLSHLDSHPSPLSIHLTVRSPTKPRPPSINLPSASLCVGVIAFIPEVDEL